MLDQVKGPYNCVKKSIQTARNLCSCSGGAGWMLGRQTAHCPMESALVNCEKAGALVGGRGLLEARDGVCHGVSTPRSTSGI